MTAAHIAHQEVALDAERIKRVVEVEIPGIGVLRNPVVAEE